ncbi:MAG: MauE/DoxX family redox-associated membrane protein [Melioribacteraceae bacterium]
MKKKIILPLRIIIGALFLFSAYSKLIGPGLIEIILVDHGISSSRETAAILVRVVIGFEFALGLLFFQPYSIKKIVAPVSFLFLSAFTVYLSYTAFVLKDMQNCGCFGEMIRMSPVESIIKNVIMMVIVSLLFKWGEEKKNKFIVPGVMILSIASVFIASPPEFQRDLKFTQYTDFTGIGRVDLSSGDKLIAVFNTECEHCRQLAYELGQMKRSGKKYPELFALMFKEGGVTADSFRTVTNSDIPYKMIEMNDFLNLIGQSPPRIYWLKEGKIKEIWDNDFQRNIIKYFPSE